METTIVYIRVRKELWGLGFRGLGFAGPLRLISSELFGSILMPYNEGTCAQYSAGGIARVFR